MADSRVLLTPLSNSASTIVTTETDSVSFTEIDLGVVALWRHVATDGNGTYVVSTDCEPPTYVGSGLLAYSHDDCATWTVISPSTEGYWPEHTARPVGPVVWAGDEFIIPVQYGSRGSFATSPDGENWTFHHVKNAAYGGGLDFRPVDRLWSIVRLANGMYVGYGKIKKVFVPPAGNHHGWGRVWGFTPKGPYSQAWEGDIRGPATTGGSYLLSPETILGYGVLHYDQEVGYSGATGGGGHVGYGGYVEYDDDGPVSDGTSSTDEWVPGSPPEAAGRYVEGILHKRKAWNPLGGYWVGVGYLPHFYLDPGGRFVWGYSEDGYHWQWTGEDALGEWWPLDVAFDGTYFWVSAVPRDGTGGSPNDRGRLLRLDPGADPLEDATWDSYDLDPSSDGGFYSLAVFPDPRSIGRMYANPSAIVFSDDTTWSARMSLSGASEVEFGSVNYGLPTRQFIHLGTIQTSMYGNDLEPLYDFAYAGASATVSIAMQPPVLTRDPSQLRTYVEPDPRTPSVELSMAASIDVRVNPLDTSDKFTMIRQHSIKMHAPEVDSRGRPRDP